MAQVDLAALISEARKRSFSLIPGVSESGESAPLMLDLFEAEYISHILHQINNQLILFFNFINNGYNLYMLICFPYA